MSDTQVITLTPDFDDPFASEHDSCVALQSILNADSVCELHLSSASAVYKSRSFISSKADNAAPSSSLAAPITAANLRLTIASQSLTLRRVAQVLSALLPNPLSVSIMANRFASGFATQAVDVFFDQHIGVDKNTLTNIALRYRVDIFEKGSATLAHPGLLVMDMDSTIIAMECIDEIAELAGVKDKVSAVTERAMLGEIPFTQSLHDRVACLEGVALPDLLGIRDRLPFMPNFIETMRVLRAANWKLAVASGGFTLFADHVKHMAQLDAAFSNQLGTVNAKLTGKVLGKVVDAEEKARVLVSLAKQFEIPHAQTVAIGDGANDLKMMDKAGMSIAYHAKPAVGAVANAAIRFSGFEGVLFALR